MYLKGGPRAGRGVAGAHGNGGSGQTAERDGLGRAGYTGGGHPARYRGYTAVLSPVRAYIR